MSVFSRDSIFNRDFYPTPENVVEQMLFGLDLKNKTVLEPSCGSGNILKVLKRHGAKTIGCELSSDLYQISSNLLDKFLKPDFLKVTSDEISYVDFIIMNPPFSADERHILHAWNIAPEGCQIISLCNANTVENTYSSYRENLKTLIKNSGTFQNLGDCFSDAERKTDTAIGLVNLYKPKVNSEFEFEGYFDLSEDIEELENGIVKYNVVRDIVNRYVEAVRKFDSVNSLQDEINKLIEPVSGSKITFGSFENNEHDRSVKIYRDEFKKSLQKYAWHTIFNMMNLGKYVTRSVIADINKFVEQQTNVPFTLKNVYKMIEMIVGTNDSRMKRVLSEAFDIICSFSYDNSEAGESWKTNSGYKVNKNFILPCVVKKNYSGKFGLNYNSTTYNKLEDVIKALCFITGKNYGSMLSLWEFSSRDLVNGEKIDVVREFGKWYKWNDFFEVKGYMKGTLHVRFISDDVWMKFNLEAAKAKGWALPKQTDTRQTGKERKKERGLRSYIKII